MSHKVIEGTWEEVLTLGPELSGHRVRVTVLDEIAVQHQDEGPSVYDLLRRSGILGDEAARPTNEVTDLARMKDRIEDADFHDSGAAAHKEIGD